MRNWSAAVALLAASACNSSSFPGTGHFEGNVVHVVGGALSDAPVKADVPDWSQANAAIQLLNLDGSKNTVIRVSGLNTGSPAFAVDELGTAKFTLSKDNDGCYATKTPKPARLCTTDSEVRFEVRSADNAPVYLLSLDRFNGQNAVQLETPKPYALDEAMSRTFSMNFDTRIEFERVMQARHLAQSAYLSLLPHLSAGSILALAKPTDVLGLLGVIGDIAPFVLPSRWLQAGQDHLLAEAERDSLILMRGDAGVQVEGFTYALARDLALQKAYVDVITQSEGVRDQVGSLEAMGQLAAGSRDLVDTSINSLKNDADALNGAIDSEKTYAAQALGLINPNAVEALTFTADPVPVELAKPLDETTLMTEAEQRSFELRQLDFLVEAARTARKTVYFSWLDPAASDPLVGLGFNMGAQLAVAQDQIQGLQAQRQKVQAVLLQNAKGAVRDYNGSLERYTRAVADADLQDRRVARIRQQIAIGAGPNQLDLATAFQDQLRARMNRENAVATYRLSRARVNRLLLEGYYAHLELTPAPTH